ncbi:coagulation factor XIII B chain-like [Latimeria chalumnae]|uniref:coagulation factor XIII B chain-like n=1 Tax=Latimeria chalumnae TaxID=7897 RepID=UPI00313AF73B
MSGENHDFVPSPEETCSKPYIYNELKTSEKENYKLGERLLFQCTERFTPNSSPVCTKSGWSLNPTCTEKRCFIPTLIKGYISPHTRTSFVRLGEEVTVNCYEGFRSTQGARFYSSKCEVNDWSPPINCIEVTCEDPGITNGRLYYNYRFPKRLRDEITYQCDHGYHTSDKRKSQTVRCTEGGWGPKPQCIEVTCEDPGITNGRLYYNYRFPKRLRDEITYQCDHGYHTSDKRKSQTVRCTEGGWGPKPQCIAVRQKCAPPPEIENAERISNSSEYYHGDTVEYKCKPPYQIEGQKLIQCENGVWSLPPVCLGRNNKCGKPPKIANGDITSSLLKEYDLNAIVEYKCQNTYVLQGEKTVKCVNGRWTRPPLCLEPCTITEDETRKRNIMLRWRKTTKLYAEHDEVTEFMCIQGYRYSYALRESDFRVKCIRGVLQYPSCVNELCIITEEEMQNKNIIRKKLYLRYSDENPKHEEVVEFECILGYRPSSFTNSYLKVQCLYGHLQLPSCVKDLQQKCGKPPTVTYGDMFSEVVPEYESGQSIKYKCAKTYKMEGSDEVHCLNGMWSNPPVCLEPCIITEDDVQEKYIKLKQWRRYPIYRIHDQTLEFSCIQGHRPSPSSSDFIVKCMNGMFILPSCVEE